MIPLDPNVQLVEVVARALDDLRDEVVFVGGCAASLLCTSPDAAPVRVTNDVDIIAEVVSLVGYHALERRFAEHGFSRDASRDAPICRWRIDGTIVDLMPTDETILGFSNRWYPAALASASEEELPSGARIRLISAPVFLATKFEAFATRGRGDLVYSHDFEDIINVLEGRSGIVTEVAECDPEIAAYLRTQMRNVLRHPDFENTLPGIVTYDELYEDRVRRVRQRIDSIAGSGV